ncbi:MAG TPA: thiamine-phosphate kinase [Terriglobales bacterium]|nr:thiamine-phosphate kinase [Terriglobales bacterium]
MPLKERELIARIGRSARALRNSAVTKAIGDDCAILRFRAGYEALVTTDFSIEGTHFRREWHPADVIGHRCLTRGLSDIAAMGGEPVAAFLSLALPGELPQKWVDGFFAGLLALAKKYKVKLAGGDVSAAPLICADIVAVGQLPRGRAVFRSGAKPGDGIYVSGELGRAAAVLQALRKGEAISPRSREAQRHFYPEPRIKVGQYLREHKLATAMIDISDGLSTDLSHLCEESGVGALISEHSIPRPSGWQFGSSSLHLALHGGDDYELLFTAAPFAKVPRETAGVRITRIGEIRADKRQQIFLVDSHGQRKLLTPGGWQAF